MKQSYINVVTKEVASFEPFEIPYLERDAWLQLIDDEEVLIHFPNEEHSETIITTQSVICWMLDELQTGVYAIREYTTPTQSHLQISEYLPLRLWAMVDAYSNDITYDNIERDALLHAIRTEKGGKK